MSRTLASRADLKEKIIALLELTPVACAHPGGGDPEAEILIRHETPR